MQIHIANLGAAVKKATLHKWTLPNSPTSVRDLDRSKTFHGVVNKKAMSEEAEMGWYIVYEHLKLVRSVINNGCVDCVCVRAADCKYFSSLVIHILLRDSNERYRGIPSECLY